MARSVYRDSFQVKPYIDNSLFSIEEGQNNLAREIAEAEYALTPEYQDLKAKELLGLRQPGEEVIIFSDNKQEITDFLPTLQEPRDQEILPNTEKWWKFIF